MKLILLINLIESKSKDVQFINTEKMLCYVNKIRGIKKLNKLQLHPILNRAAQLHSEDMSKSKKMDHTGSDGSNPSERLKRQKLDYLKMGENVAVGQNSITRVMKDWYNSPGHRANILGSDFTHLGVGLDKNGYYWTQEFAKLKSIDIENSKNSKNNSSLIEAWNGYSDDDIADTKSSEDCETLPEFISGNGELNPDSINIIDPSTTIISATRTETVTIKATEFSTVLKTTTVLKTSLSLITNYFTSTETVTKKNYSTINLLATVTNYSTLMKTLTSTKTIDNFITQTKTVDKFITFTNTQNEYITLTSTKYIDSQPTSLASENQVEISEPLAPPTLQNQPNSLNAPVAIFGNNNLGSINNPTTIKPSSSKSSLFIKPTNTNFGKYKPHLNNHRPLPSRPIINQNLLPSKTFY